MKGYRGFIITFSVVMVLYIVTEVNRPKPVDWRITLSKDDKIPYGGYVIHQQLKDVFPAVPVRSFRSPLYNQVNNFDESNTAYVILSPNFHPSISDVQELKSYVSNGNYVLIAANVFGRMFLDSLKIKLDAHYSISNKDSTRTNFVNPALKSPTDYTFFHTTIDQYFSAVDTAKTLILGINNHKQPDYIKINYGDGAFFIHANPVCFSNYFLLRNNNASYAAKALSYIPADVSVIFWDEYYKLGREGATTPLRFLLSNEYLRWALRLALIGLVLYVLFQVKRRQRIIPVVEPLRNSTLDFIKTVSNVYFNTRDNKAIAEKRITYFLEFIRHRFNLSTHDLDESFIEQLSRKSGVEKDQVAELVTLLTGLKVRQVNDAALLMLNNKIDHFYKQV